MRYIYKLHKDTFKVDIIKVSSIFFHLIMSWHICLWLALKRHSTLHKSMYLKCWVP